MQLSGEVNGIDPQHSCSELVAVLNEEDLEDFDDVVGGTSQIERSLNSSSRCRIAIS